MIMLSRKQGLLILIISMLYTSLVSARCYNADSPFVIDSSSKQMSKDRCIKSEKFLTGIYGWNILKLTLTKNYNNPTLDKYAYPGFSNGNEESYLKEKYNLKSGTNKTNRCSILFNTPGLFYKDFNNSGNPTAGVKSRLNLRDFWKSMEDYDSDSNLESRGFRDLSTGRASRQMYSSSGGGGDTCGALGMCVCKKSLNCTELSTFYNVTNPVGVGTTPTATRVKNSNNFKYDLSNSDFSRMDNWCYKIKPCDGTDKSPKKLCEDHGGSNCGSWSQNCLYTTECKLKTTETNYDSINLPSCNHSFECGSGYCEKLPQSIKGRIQGDVTIPNRRVCLPHSLCTPKCTKINDRLDTSHDYCCLGLVSYGGVCKKNATSFDPPPPMLVREVDPSKDNCEYEIKYVGSNENYCMGADHWDSKSECESNYEWLQVGSLSLCRVNGVSVTNLSEDQCLGGQWFDNSDALKMRFIYYQRLFEGLQWLWGDADSPGLNDNFGMYLRAKKTAKRFRNEEEALNDDFYSIMDEAKKNFTNNSQFEGAATGVGALKAMGRLFESLSKLSFARSKLYYDISGLEVVLSPPSGGLSFTEMVNSGQMRIAGSKTDNALSGGTYKRWIDPNPNDSNRHDRDFVASDADTWKNKTLMGVWKKVNSMKRLNSQGGSGRFDAHGGKDNCGFFRKKVGKNSTPHCKRKRNNGNFIRAWCSWEKLTSGRGINDGDCIKEGWIINDSSSGSPVYHSSPGSGGLIDAIYPTSIRSSYIQESLDDLYSSINKFLVSRSYAGAKRAKIGGQVTPVTSGVLLDRIERRWAEFANFDHTMTTNCIGAQRPFIPGKINVEEAYFLDQAEGGSLDYLEFKNQVFKNLTASEKRDRFLKLSAKIIRDFFINFHWHVHDPAKGTYRFYKDRDNDGEYNGMVDLINASLWLSSFYEYNEELNLKIGQCMFEKAEKLEEALQSSPDNKIRNRNNYEALMGNRNSEFPNCPDNQGEVTQGDRDNPGAPSSPGSPGGGGGIGGVGIDVGPGVENKKSLSENLKKDSLDKTSEDTAINFSNKSSINSVDVGSRSESGVVSSGSESRQSGSPGSVGSGNFSTNAKLESIRKEIKKDLKKSVPFLNVFSKKLASYKNPALRIQTLEAVKYTKPVYASIDPSILSVGNNIQEKENINVEKLSKEDFDDDFYDEDYDDSDYASSSKEEAPRNEEISRLIKHIERSKTSYKHDGNDTIFEKISKTYMRVGLRKLVGRRPRKRINKRNLPSLKTKKTKTKSTFFD